MEAYTPGIDPDAAAAAAAADFLAAEGLSEPSKPKDVPPAKIPPEPLDFFGDTSLTGRQDMRPDMLPKVIWDYAEDAAARPGLNPAAIAAGCLVTAAAAIREGWRIQPKMHDTEWTEQPILWFGLTGSSGAKKTQALKSSVAPLYAIEKINTREAELIRKEYLRDKAFYNEEMKIWRSQFKEARIKGGMSYVEAMDTYPKPEAPKEPAVPRLVVGDTTVEALMNLCAANPSGIVQVRDELSEWLASFDLYSGGTGNRDRGKYLTAYNGGSETKDRASDEEGPLRIDNFAVSIMGGIQDDVLTKRFSSDTHDGFLARFLMCRADRVEGVDRAPDAAKVAAYFQAIFRLNAGSKAPKDHDRIIRMSPAAAAVREEIEGLSYALAEHPLVVKGLSDHLNKWPGIFTRLCLVFHMLDAAEADRVPAPEVSEETARRAFRLLTEFFLPEAARIYNEVIRGDKKTEHARWIAGHILAQGADKVTVFDIKRAFSTLDGDQRAIEEATQILEMSAWITPDGNRAARYDFAKMKWRVNPRVHAMFAERAEKEREQRDASKAQIAKGAAAIRKLRARK